MSRRAIVLLTVVAAISIACTGVVWAQDSGIAQKPGSTSQQSAESNVIPGRYIVVLEDEDRGRAAAEASADAQQARQVAEDLSQGDRVEDVTQTYGATLKGFAAEIPAGKVDDVRSDPRVAFVAEDREVHASAQILPKGVDRVDADWDTDNANNTNSVDAGNGSGAVDADIAILDSGIYTKHPDLTIAGGKDCSSDGKRTYSDDNGHGSHVAGIAAAEDNATGVVGTAPGARLWAVKVLKADGSGSWSNIICGINWVTKQEIANADVIEVANMSLGGRVTENGTADDNDCGETNKDPLHLAICKSVDAGVPYVVAAGNDNQDVTNYAPASYDEVITVSALADYNGEPFGGAPKTCLRANPDDNFAFFSNYATLAADQAHMLGAPGVCIKSTWKGMKKGRPGDRRIVPGYKTISGTSMASPHVAGAAAVYSANNPTATPDEVRSFMLAPANTEAIGQGHTDKYNNNPEPVLQMDNY